MSVFGRFNGWSDCFAGLFSVDFRPCLLWFPSLPLIPDTPLASARAPGRYRVRGVRRVGAGYSYMHHQEQPHCFFALSLLQYGRDMTAGGRIDGGRRPRRRPRGWSCRTRAGIALELDADRRALDRGPGSVSRWRPRRWVWVLSRALAVIQGAGSALDPGRGGADRLVIQDRDSTRWMLLGWMFTGCSGGGFSSVGGDFCYYCFAFASAKFPAFPLATHALISTR